ncbi:diguanylate cyclase domain-containing protein [Sedimenticola thiotaurini]|uniref:diguanylate cyclase n=1 Tax=Sedimenticola thiotaurini TaxID=1543721 RepID=A0A0F7JWM6_9GAMM|nr:diguanylate cyclase [Sedimenticola thiotaurini]AKH19175.1 diguanylate cyclase [Sedimenticola thiotaurini]
MPTEFRKEKTVLIIDDSPINIEHLAQVLKSEYNIKVANSGASGIEVARKQRPDLILLDIVMPNIDGYEVCRRLKAGDGTRKIPIIFISTKTDVEDETRGLELGAVDYITKPFRTPIVKARVRTQIQLKHNSDLLEKLALIDALTNLPNRRRFEQILKREWSRCRRSQAPISIMLLDIDHFKQFNDHYGHPAGDRCLKQVAQALPLPLKRPADSIFRYGGEEFIAVLPETEYSVALKLAEKMRLQVANLAIPHAQSSDTHPYISISIGVTATTPSSRSNPKMLVQLADTMLYEAKNSGRNCVRGEEFSNQTDSQPSPGSV